MYRKVSSKNSAIDIFECKNDGTQKLDRHKMDELFRGKARTACRCNICNDKSGICTFSKNDYSTTQTNAIVKYDILEVSKKLRLQQRRPSKEISGPFRRVSILKPQGSDNLPILKALSFRDLMQQLLGPTDTILGCPIQFTDTAFFDDNGKVSEIIRTDKEGFLCSIKNETKLGIQEIRRSFSCIVRDRRKEIQSELILQQTEQEAAKPNIVKKKGFKKSQKSTLFSEDQGDDDKSQEDEEDANSHLKDAAILRFNDEYKSV